jgi:hypothetical protein
MVSDKGFKEIKMFFGKARGHVRAMEVGGITGINLPLD